MKKAAIKTANATATLATPAELAIAKLAEKRTESRTEKLESARSKVITLSVPVEAWVYGMLCEAALIHEIPSPAAAVSLFLENTITDWANIGFDTDCNVQ